MDGRVVDDPLDVDKVNDYDDEVGMMRETRM